MAESGSHSRRDIIKATAILAPALVLDKAQTQEAFSPGDLKKSAPAISNLPHSANYRPGFFTPAEWRFIIAACDRLIPHDGSGPGAVELGVPEYIDRQMQTSYADGGIWYMQGPFIEVAPEFGYQSKLTPKEHYRLGIRAIDAYCNAAFGKPFAQLESAKQDELLKQIETGGIKSEDVPLKTFFTSFLLKNTLEGYFGDPSYGGNKDMGSWKMIGYPGVRADYKDFVDTANKPYPYGPVSLYGQRG